MFKKLGLLALAPALLLSCGGQKQYRFVGRVFDGVTGAQIKKYTIELGYLNNRNKGEVDKNGHYILPSLPSMHDFTIVVSGAGDYREFYSVNQGWSDFGQGKQTGAGTGRTNNYHSTTNSTTEPNYPRGYDLPESYEYDVYLFPKGLKAPATEIDLFYSDSAQRPATGTVRLVPTTATSNLQYAAPSVATQVWPNTADLQFGVVSGVIANGVVLIPEGSLMYGVTYTIAVFGVPGYGVPAAVTTFVAGAANSVVPFTLTPLTNAGTATIAVVYRNDVTNLVNTTGEFKVVFNQPVKFNETIPLAHMASLVDAYVQASGVVPHTGDGDASNDPTPRTDARTGVDPNLCGVTISLDAGGTGTVLTIGWAQSTCLGATGGRNVTGRDGLGLVYGALDQVSLVPTQQGANAPAQALGTILGGATTSEITIKPTT